MEIWGFPGPGNRCWKIQAGSHITINAPYICISNTRLDELAVMFVIGADAEIVPGRVELPVIVVVVPGNMGCPRNARHLQASTSQLCTEQYSFELCTIDYPGLFNAIA